MLNLKHEQMILMAGAYLGLISCSSGEGEEFF